jgi:glycosyltransferase involved in cell wall biosynthesis
VRGETAYNAASMAAPLVLQVGSRSTRSLATRKFASTRAARITYCEADGQWAGLPGDLARKLCAEFQAREPWLLRLGLKERVVYAGLLGAALLIQAGFAGSVLILPLDWTCDPEEEPAGIGEHVPLDSGLAFAMTPDVAPPEWGSTSAPAAVAWSVMDGPVAYVSDPLAAATFIDAGDLLARSRSRPDNCLEKVLIAWVLQGRIQPFRQRLVINAENLASWRAATPTQAACAFVQPETPCTPFVFNRLELRPVGFIWQTPGYYGLSGFASHVRDRIRSALRAKAEIRDPRRGGADPISGAEQYMLRRYLGQSNVQVTPEWKKDFVRWMLGADESADGLSRIESEIYRHRPDLRAAFPWQSGFLGRELRRWFVQCGLAELGIVLIERSDLETGRAPHDAVLQGGGKATVAFDVHVIGYLDSTMGLGISAQNQLRALELSGVSVASTAVPLPGAPETAPPRKVPIKSRVSLIVVNGELLHNAVARLDGEALRNSRRIGVWAWELPQASPQMLRGLPLVDELWVPSGFVRDAFRPHTRKAITVVPHPVWASDPDAPGDDDPLPAGPYFFFAFDYNSAVERKNPFGLVAAFTSAFADGSGPQLVIKTLHAGQHAEDHERLLDAARQRNDIHVIEGTWPRAMVHRALRNSLGVVSLHRAEGYGLLLAEAMAHGKPTIATGYSGNLEFQHPGNSLLVGYRPAQVPAGCLHYGAGGTWAEPDMDEAAKAMRAVFKGGRDIDAIARAGAQTVRERLAPDVVGRQMKGLLEKHLQRTDGAASLVRQWRRLFAI